MYVSESSLGLQVLIALGTVCLYTPVGDFLKHLGSALNLKCIGRCFLVSCSMTTELRAVYCCCLDNEAEQNRTRCIYYLTLVCYYPTLPPQWLRAFKNIFRSCKSVQSSLLLNLIQQNTLKSTAHLERSLAMVFQ